MRIKCGEYDIFATGSVQGVLNFPIKISLNDKDKPKALIFNFIFEDDSTEKEAIRFSKTSPNEYKVSLINFSKSIGSGSYAPMKLGALYGRELFFSYRINTIPNSEEKLFYYTWYLGNLLSENSPLIEIST
jgi:hypothetical protein